MRQSFWWCNLLGARYLRSVVVLLSKRQHEIAVALDRGTRRTRQLSTLDGDSTISTDIRTLASISVVLVEHSMMSIIAHNHHTIFEVNRPFLSPKGIDIRRLRCHGLETIGSMSEIAESLIENLIRVKFVYKKAIAFRGARSLDLL